VHAFLHALSQQEASGAMPDGILLVEGAELKYINQVPHTDHCVWLPVCLKTYLDETGDYAMLNEDVVGHSEGDGVAATVFERVSSAMDWLLSSARRARPELHRPGRLVRSDEHGRLQGARRIQAG
jgi:cellobionic acid phosphorylase